MSALECLSVYVCVCVCVCSRKRVDERRANECVIMPWWDGRLTLSFQRIIPLKALATPQMQVLVAKSPLRLCLASSLSSHLFSLHSSPSLSLSLSFQARYKGVITRAAVPTQNSRHTTAALCAVFKDKYLSEGESTPILTWPTLPHPPMRWFYNPSASQCFLSKTLSHFVSVPSEPLHKSYLSSRAPSPLSCSHDINALIAMPWLYVKWFGRWDALGCGRWHGVAFRFWQMDRAGCFWSHWSYCRFRTDYTHQSPC